MSSFDGHGEMKAKESFGNSEELELHIEFLTRPAEEVEVLTLGLLRCFGVL